MKKPYFKPCIASFSTYILIVASGFGVICIPVVDDANPSSLSI